MIKKIVASLLTIALALAWVALTRPKNALAMGTLEDAADNVSEINSGMPNVGHEISYTLPLTSFPVQSHDYITIDMPGFSNIVAPTSFIGLYGAPAVEVIDHSIHVHNVTQAPGTRVQIFGLRADNPTTISGYTVTISIHTDTAVGIIRDQVQLIASSGGMHIRVSVSIISPLTALSLSGFTGPDSFVYLTENGQVIGTSSSDVTGAFWLFLTGIESGAHSYRLSSTDSNNRSSSQNALNFYLEEGSLTNVTGILLSPTIQLNRSQIQRGDSLTISGSSKPDSEVSIFTESPLRSYMATSLPNGEWSYTLGSSDTNNLTPGEYRVYSLVQDEQANQSAMSPTLTFTVTSNEVENPEPACDISHGDLNCDGKTNLTDFSILLYHWKTNHKKADINRDGAVNLVDFSIMMYYFRR